MMDNTAPMNPGQASSTQDVLHRGSSFGLLGVIVGVMEAGTGRRWVSRASEVAIEGLLEADGTEDLWEWTVLSPGPGPSGAPQLYKA